MFCKHKWKLLSETHLKSKFETAVDAIRHGCIPTEERTKVPAQMCDATRKHIQVFTCEKCGKLKRYVEEI